MNTLHFLFSGIIYRENGTIEGSRFWDFGTKNGTWKDRKYKGKSRQLEGNQAVQNQI